jgi:hypothetical protein
MMCVGRDARTMRYISCAKRAARRKTAKNEL